MSGCQLVAFIESQNVDISENPLSDTDVVTAFEPENNTTDIYNFIAKTLASYLKLRIFEFLT